MRLFTLLLVFLLIYLSWSTGRAESNQLWRFQVLLNDQPIGEHQFLLERVGDYRLLVSQADMAVEFLIFTAYRYQHTSHEVWQGDCLRRIESHTDDNGQHFSVQSESTDTGLLIKSDQVRQPLADCPMTFAYWNPRMLEQDRLLNVQDGKYPAVSFNELDERTIEWNGENIRVRTIELSADEVSMRLFYDQHDRWLGLESPRDGRVIRYRPIEIPAIEPRHARVVAAEPVGKQ